MDEGTIAALWRYPVKSMRGEDLDRVEVRTGGLLGDRAWAIVDAGDGTIASASDPRRWPGLLDLRAAREPRGEDASVVRIELPGGERVEGGTGDADAVLSARIGRPVRLERRAEAFHDCARVHLLTDATVARLAAEHPAGRFDARRFRPNILIATTRRPAAFVEDEWIGRTLSLGEEVALRITGPYPRCLMTTLPQDDLEHGPGILRAATKIHEGNVGVYAEVLRPGLLRRGDRVTLD